MNPTLIDLDALTDEILAMPEVLTIYPQRSAVIELGAQLLDRLGERSPRQLLTAEERDGILHIAANVGILDGQPAPTTGLAIGTRIMEHFATLPTDHLAVTIRIATIG